MNLNDEVFNEIAVAAKAYNAAPFGTEARATAAASLDRFANSLSERQIEQVVKVLLRRGIA